MRKLEIHIFALAAHGVGLSGSDRIFIEFARRWSRDNQINIYLWTEGREMCRTQHLNNKNIKFNVSLMNPWKNLGFLINYFARIVEGARLGLTLNVSNDGDTFLYSASDFWMDTLPCLFLKLRFTKIKWITTWYQSAPNPFIGYTEGRREEKYRFRALLYWLSQFPIKPLISRFADFVLVNNESERSQFPNLEKQEKVIVVLGAVDISKTQKWISQIGKVPKVYDAVFQGRLHPQKGVVELMEIWKKVVEKRRDAKLVILGDGPLMGEVKAKIHKLNLKNNISLLGYVFDGSKKYRTFSQSKIVVHPAFYDSGGMASAEAMAFGLPCVGFNLKSYDSYYPKGMIRIEIGDLDAFATAILKLLSDEEYRKKIGHEAAKMISNNWSWDQRAKEVIDYVTS